MKSFTLYQKLIQYSAVLLLATGCTVYAPMQPAISTISRQGQAELSASVQANGRVESSGVYSPLPHVLVLAAGTFRPKLNDSVFAATRQWEAGVGGYLPLGHHWQLTGLTGYGYARSSRGFREVPAIFFGDGRSHTAYEARHSKLFGQVGLTHEFSRGSIGVEYRLSRVHFDQLDFRANYAAYAIPLRSMTRHEGLLFGRYSLDAGQRWQLQSTMGLSMTRHFKEDDTLDPRIYEANRTRLPVPMLSLGVVFRPQFSKAE